MTAVAKSDAWKEIFQLYRELNVLWLPSSNDCIKRAQRERAWQTLLNKYKQIDPDATLDTIKHKITNLRTCYKRELKRLQMVPHYKTSLWYFSELDFLRDHLTLLNNNAPQLSLRGKRRMLPSAAQIQAETAKKLKVINDDEDSLNTNFTIIEAAPFMPTQETDKLRETEERDEADIYADNWATQFRKLTEVQRLFAKKAIEDILFLGRFQHLTMSTVQMPTEQNLFSEEYLRDE